MVFFSIETDLLKVVLILLAIGYTAYFLYVVIAKFDSEEEDVRLVWVTCLVVFILIVIFVHWFFSQTYKEQFESKKADIVGRMLPAIRV